MPYHHGYSRESMSRNVEIFTREGYPQPQAVAMSYDVARRAWRKAHGSAAYPEYLRGGPRTSTRKKRKNRTGVCRCDAYHFPHQRGGGMCRG